MRRTQPVASALRPIIAPPASLPAWAFPGMRLWGSLAGEPIAGRVVTSGFAEGNSEVLVLLVVRNIHGGLHTLFVNRLGASSWGDWVDVERAQIAERMYAASVNGMRPAFRLILNTDLSLETPKGFDLTGTLD